MKLKSVSIFGAGMAGLPTALMLKNYFKVEVIDTDKIMNILLPSLNLRTQAKFYQMLGYPDMIRQLEKEKGELEEALNVAEDNYLEEKERCEGLEKTIKLLEREKED